MGLFFIILAILVLVIIGVNISVVQQSRAYVIERLGAFHTVWGVGMHFKIPFFDRIARRVSLKEGPRLSPPACHHQGQRHHADRHRCLLPDY